MYQPFLWGFATMIFLSAAAEAARHDSIEEKKLSRDTFWRHPAHQRHVQKCPPFLRDFARMIPWSAAAEAARPDSSEKEKL